MSVIVRSTILKVAAMHFSKNLHKTKMNLRGRNNQGVFALEENRKRALELLEKWIKEEEERVERSDNDPKRKR